jgi:hypothetical protein
MRAFLTILAAWVAIAAACKKEPESSPPPPLPRAMTQPTGMPTPSSGIQGREKPPPWDPAKKFHGREPIKLRPNQGRLLDRLRAGKLSALAGSGTLSAVIDKEVVSLPVEVFRRGPVLVLSGERPDLGIVLTIPSAAPGTYVRGQEPAQPPPQPRAQPQPHLRVRYGAGPQAKVYLPRDKPGQPGLTIEVVESSSTIRGTFRGMVALGDAPEAKVVREGKFTWTVEPQQPPSTGK